MNATSPTDEAIYQLGKELACSVCLSLLKVPTARLPCSHYYCRGCLVQSLAAKAECPLCKSKANRRDIGTDDKMDRIVAAYALIERASGQAFFCSPPPMPAKLTPPAKGAQRESPAGPQTSQKPSSGGRRGRSAKAAGPPSPVPLPPLGAAPSPSPSPVPLASMFDDPASPANAASPAGDPSKRSSGPFFWLGGGGGGAAASSPAQAPSSMFDPMDMGDTDDDVSRGALFGGSGDGDDEPAPPPAASRRRGAKAARGGKKAAGKPPAAAAAAAAAATPPARRAPRVSAAAAGAGAVTQGTQPGTQTQVRRGAARAAAGLRPWSCPSCTFENKCGAAKCDMCRAKRPTGAAAAALVRPSPAPTPAATPPPPAAAAAGSVETTQPPSQRPTRGRQSLPPAPAPGPAPPPGPAPTPATAKSEKPPRGAAAGKAGPPQASQPSQLTPGSQEGGCAFCGGEEDETLGEMVPVDSSMSRHVHTSCALWAPQVYEEGGAFKNLASEVRRGRKLKCACCGRPGAVLGCSTTTCRKTYHYSCAAGGSATGVRLDEGQFQLQCPDHAPKAGGRKRALASIDPNADGGMHGGGAAAKFARRASAGGRAGAATLEPAGGDGRWGENLVICMSGLTPDEKETVEELARAAGARTERKWTPAVTHGPPLEGFSVYSSGRLQQISDQDIKQLLRMCGAKILSRPPTPDDAMALVLLDPDEAKGAAGRGRSSGAPSPDVPAVGVAWLLDSASLCAPQRASKYAL